MKYNVKQTMVTSSSKFQTDYDLIVHLGLTVWYLDSSQPDFLPLKSIILIDKQLKCVSQAVKIALEHEIQKIFWPNELFRHWLLKFDT